MPLFEDQTLIYENQNHEFKKQRLEGVLLETYLNVNNRIKEETIPKQISNNAKEVKHYPMSIYFYDSRDVEQELHNQSRKSEKLLDLKKIPKWVEKIYQNYKPHTGEAPIFCGQFLPSNKAEQSSSLRPQTCSFVRSKSHQLHHETNLYCQHYQPHRFLMASKSKRRNESDQLQNTHRQQLSSVGHNLAKINSKKIEDTLPTKEYRDSLPAKFQPYEITYSFLVGTRYNSPNLLDLKSFADIGLYIQRNKRPVTFLKKHKYEDSRYCKHSDYESDILSANKLNEPKKYKNKRMDKNSFDNHDIQSYSGYKRRPSTHPGSRRELIASKVNRVAEKKFA